MPAVNNTSFVGRVLPAACLQKCVIAEGYFLEGKVWIILQNCFIFPNFSQMQKCADISQNLLSDEMSFHLTHQLLASTVRLHILGHLMHLQYFACSFRLKTSFTHKCVSN